jgi:hypothetical protein
MGWQPAFDSKRTGCEEGQMTENDSLEHMRQIYRQQRTDEYTASIRQPGDEVVAITIDQSDVEALGAAIAACTPQQVARWFCEVLNAQTTYFDVNERLWLTNDDNEWRAEDDA